jgi:predicted flap endonuclease-1-like 5' DNA nuclease
MHLRPKKRFKEVEMFDFQGLGLSSYVLCYGPLALVIFGFIAFAILTDGKARRTYLRRLDPRPEAERVDEGPINRTSPIDARTPSGVSVRILPGTVALAAAPPMPAAPTRTTAVDLEAVAEVVPDDLKRIEGIGPKINSVLNAAGVHTFAQVAAMTPEALRQILDDAKMSAIHNPSTWPEQAALAAAGNWAALEQLQEELTGGRR